MKTLAQSFLTQDEQDALKACVRDVESRTSGEIVPVIASTSYHYPRAGHIGSLTLALITAAGGAMLLGREDMWVYLALFLPLYMAFNWLFTLAPNLKRPFILKRVMREEVEEAAVTAFYLNGLHRTRDLTGVIIYVSVFERSVQILADKGINDKVDPQAWESIVADITHGIRAGNPGKALCTGVQQCGDLITKHFPVKHDDTNELPDLIIEK